MVKKKVYKIISPKKGLVIIAVLLLLLILYSILASNDGPLIERAVDVAERPLASPTSFDVLMTSNNVVLKNVFLKHYYGGKEVDYTPEDFSMFPDVVAENVSLRFRFDIDNPNANKKECDINILFDGAVNQTKKIVLNTDESRSEFIDFKLPDGDVDFSLEMECQDG